MSQKHTVEFFYDVVSPYSLLAFEVLHRLVDKWNLNLILRPFFLGGVMSATGNRPPASVPAKAVYLVTDLDREANYYGVSRLHTPSRFPLNTLNSMRFLTAVAKQSPTHLAAVSRELWKGYWVNDKDISQSEELVQAAVRAGMKQTDAESALQLSQTQEIKDLLKKTTDEAVQRGAFGAPTMFVQTNSKKETEEMYFGSDRFHLIAKQLGVEWNPGCPKL